MSFKNSCSPLADPWPAALLLVGEGRALVAPERVTGHACAFFAEFTFEQML